MTKIRVGVVRGGPSSEYPVSLRTGESVLKNLDTEKYLPVDILVSTHGDWYIKGVRTNLEAIAQQVDVIWNALHGIFGEDGKVQQLFEDFGIPYTGSGVLASSVGMHKGLAKERFKHVGLRVPEGIIVSNADEFDDVMFLLTQNLNLRPPVIVKPVTGGSSVATRLVYNMSDLKEAIGEAGRYGDVLIEEYIEGKEATVCVVDTGKTGEHLVLHPIEIIPPSENDFFDYDAKYSGASQEICPGRFTSGVNTKLRELALKAHKAIGARHYSRSDFIISSKGIAILEINTLPGLTPDSLLPKALQAGEVKLPEFFDHVIGLALAGK